MKTRIDDINELLYQQIANISNSNLKKEALGEEIERSKAMALLASQYVAAETLKMRKEFAEKQMVLQDKKIAGYLG